MKTGHKVTIGSCDPGSVNGSFAYRLIQLAQARSSRLGPFVRIKGSGLLSKQRNRVVKQFLDNTDSDWLLMIAGLVFAGFGVPGKPYPKPVPAIFQDSDKGFLPLYKYDKNSVFEIDAAGTGCLMVHRSVLEKMREVADPNQGKDWCWFWDGPVAGEWIGEDLLFCRRAKALGFKIHVNTAAVLPHQKSFWMEEVHNDIWKD
jgi:hypothetical protein